MNTNKQKNSPISARRFVFHFQFFTATPIFFLLMPFFSKRVIHSSVFAKERSAVLSFELETVDFTFARYRSKITEFDFRFRHRYASLRARSGQNGAYNF